MNALRTSKGFTLIELLVVIAIIGILAAIAIPQFSAYRKKGFDASVQADARNAATAEESYFVQAQAYINAGACTALPGMPSSKGVTCTLGAGTITPGYTISTSHTGQSFTTGCTYDNGTSPNLSCS